MKERAANYDQFISIVEKQEELLRFRRFSRGDVWRLGRVMAESVLENNLALAVCIRSISGLVLFQYCTQGATLNNEIWMNKKFNVVRELETSSFLNQLKLLKTGRTLADQGRDPKLYAASGGGFPIKLKDSGLTAAVLASGLPGSRDHDFLVACVSRFLKIADVPRLPESVEI
jgi:uncharacterized protein (UPF0303 family)